MFGIWPTHECYIAHSWAYLQAGHTSRYGFYRCYPSFFFKVQVKAFWLEILWHFTRFSILLPNFLQIYNSFFINSSTGATWSLLLWHWCRELQFTFSCIYIRWCRFYGEQFSGTYLARLLRGLKVLCCLAALCYASARRWGIYWFLYKTGIFHICSVKKPAFDENEVA